MKKQVLEEFKKACANTLGAVITVLLIFSFSTIAHAQKFGANYNENIDQIDPALIKQSGTKWVRAFVPIMPLLKINNGTITGVNSNAVNNVKIGKFLDTHRLHNTNLILSFKIRYKDIGRVPAPNSNEAKHIINACKKLLARSAGPSGNAIKLGKNIKILTVTNEPMYETPTNAVHYKALTKKIAKEMNKAKNNNNYSYDIYMGAVNDYSNNRNNPIAKATIELTKSMSIVKGMDIHPHVKKYSEINDDIKFLRQDLGGSKKIISTEWSLHRLVKSKLGTTLGNWGANNGYGRNTKIWQFVNRLIEQRSNGNPISISKLKSFWNSRSWYQSNWVDQFYNAFKQHKVSIVTYGMVRKHDPSFRMTAGKPAWIFNALYNDALLGKPAGAQPRANPFSHPRWKHYVDNPGPVALKAPISPDDLPDDIEDVSIDDRELMLFKNPVQDNLDVQFNAELPGRLTVTTFDGRTVLTKDKVQDFESIDVSSLQKGLYILKIDNGKESVTKKIIVE